MPIQVALIPLICLLVGMMRRYKRLAVVHPATWFAAAWVMAVASYSLLELFNAVPIHNESQISELLTFLLITSGAFLLCAWLAPPPKRGRATSRLVTRAISSIEPRPVLVAAGFGLVSSIINWYFMTGAATYVEAVRQQWLKEIPVLTARLWWPYMATYPAAFISAYSIMSDRRMNRKQRRLVLLAAVFAGAAGIIWSLGTGGRQAFGIVVLYGAVGASAGWAFEADHLKKQTLRIYLRLLGGVIIVLVVLAGLVELTGRIRAEEQGHSVSPFATVAYLSVVGQFVDYMGATISTYQSYGPAQRRDLTETGPVTFGALHDFGVGYLAGWRRPQVLDTNPERTFASRGLQLASGTRCVFYDLVADFGFGGGLFGVSVLVILSQMAFSWSVRRAGGALISMAPLAMCLMFWGYSHQFSLLMHDTAKWLAVSFGLWDIVYLFSRRATPGARRAIRPDTSNSQEDAVSTADTQIVNVREGSF